MSDLKHTEDSFIKAKNWVRLLTDAPVLVMSCYAAAHTIYWRRCAKNRDSQQDSDKIGWSVKLQLALMVV